MDLLKTINFALKWKIPNFTALAGIESRNFAPMYPYTLPINEQITLQLSLHLNGDLLSRRGYAALILYLIKFPKDNLVINFRASLIDQDGKKRFTTAACVRFIFSRGTNSGWPDFVRLEDILNSANKLLPNDTLTVYLELELYEAQLLTPDIFPSKTDLPPSWYHDMSRISNTLHIQTESSLPEESVRTCKFAHIWTIDNFSDLLKLQSGEFIDSKNFIFPLDKTVQFYLRLCPNGYNRNTENHLDLLLSYIIRGICPKVTVFWKISILDEHFKKVNQQFSMGELILTDIGKTVRFVMSKFISHRDIKNMRKSMIPGDRLTLLCEIDAVHHPTVDKLAYFDQTKYRMQLGSKQLSSSGDFTEGHTNARTSSKKCEHTWIIEDVHKSVTGVASFLLSDKPDFIMTFLPNGHPSEDPGSVAIMCMLMYNEDVTFRTKISIVDIFGNKSHFKEIQRKNDATYGIFPKYINKKYLLDPANGMLSKDSKLRLHFEMTFMIESSAPSKSQESYISRYLYENFTKYYHNQDSETSACTQVIRMHHRWTLKNFETYLHVENEKKFDILSNTFHSPINERFKYHMTIFAQSMKRPLDEQKKMCLALSSIFSSYGLGNNCTMQQGVWLINQTGGKHVIKEDSQLCLQDFKTLDMAFIELDDLLDAEKKLFINGDLIIYCEICICDNSTTELYRNDNFVVSDFFRQWKVLKQTEVVSHSESVCELSILNCEHTWTIEDFDTYGEINEDCPSVESDSFSPEENDRLQFTLRVYPNGESGQDRRMVNIYLFAASFEKSKVIVQIKLSILNDSGEQFFTAEKSEHLSKETNFDWLTEVQRDGLIENDLLLNNRLSIHCEIKTLLEPVNHSVDYQNVTIEAGLSKKLTHNQYTDVVLSFTDSKKRLHAHKVALTARSKVFEAMFEHDMQEQVHSEVEITDIPVEVFERLLGYIYMDKIELTDIEMAIELLIASEKYGLDRLKFECDEWLCLHMSVETAAEILVLADMYRADQLKAYALNYIRKNSRKVSQTNNFQKLSHSRRDLLDELKLDEQTEECLNSDQEEDISVL